MEQFNVYMIRNLRVYVLGHYRQGATDGLGEFNFQNVNMLKDKIDFHFLEFLQEEEANYYVSINEGPVVIHRFGSKNISLNALPSGFRSWIKIQQFDNSIFHLNHIYNFRNFLLARILNRKKVSYLVTPHDSYVYCDKFRLTRPLLKRWYRDVFVKVVDAYVLNHAALIHALTPQCKPCLNLISKNEVAVVANQVSELGITFNASALRSVFCFIGRSDIYQKGIDRTLRGFAGFKLSGKDLQQFQFKIVGPSDEYSDSLRQSICTDLGLAIDRDVVLCGRVSEEVRNQILEESLAYVHLSRFEGFGLSVIQALSASKPVIISSQVPTHDIIREYGAGFVVDTDEEITRAMHSVVSLSDEEYQVMAFNARRCYEKEFHPSVIAPQLLALFYRVAGKN